MNDSRPPRPNGDLVPPPTGNSYQPPQAPASGRGVTQAQLDNWFTYHRPEPEDLPRLTVIRDAAHEFAKVVVANTPPSADQTAAVRKIREAVMTANAAIMCRGR